MLTNKEAIQILSTRDAHGVLCGYTSGVTEALDMAIDALSAEAGQRGEWKRVSADKYVQHAYHFYRCDKCGYDHIGKTNFCPNCGADMRGEKE